MPTYKVSGRYANPYFINRPMRQVAHTICNIVVLAGLIEEHQAEWLIAHVPKESAFCVVTDAIEGPALAKFVVHNIRKSSCVVVEVDSANLGDIAQHLGIECLPDAGDAWTHLLNRDVLSTKFYAVRSMQVDEEFLEISMPATTYAR